jgi:hypothetical protein
MALNLHGVADIVNPRGEYSGSIAEALMDTPEYQEYQEREDFEQTLRDYLLEEIQAEPSELDIAMEEYMLWAIEQAMAAEEDPTLSDTERETLDAMANQAIELFESSLQRGYEQNWQRAIAEQTALGRFGTEGQVSSLGDYAMADVYERYQDVLSQGAGQISQQRMQAELDILQGEKQLDFAGRQLAASGIGVAGQYSLASDPLNVVANIYGAEADRAMQMAIAQQQASAMREASRYQMFGNIAGLGAMAAFS